MNAKGLLKGKGYDWEKSEKLLKGLFMFTQQSNNCIVWNKKVIEILYKLCLYYHSLKIIGEKSENDKT